jgi:hypothetical protein
MCPGHGFGAALQEQAQIVRVMRKELSTPSAPGGFGSRSSRLNMLRTDPGHGNQVIASQHVEHK